MKDKTRLMMTKIFGASLVLGIVVFLIYVFITESEGGLPPMTLFWLLVPAAAIIVVLIIFLKRMSSGVKSGLPLQDEMSQRLKEKTGYLSFMAIMCSTSASRLKKSTSAFMVGVLYTINPSE